MRNSVRRTFVVLVLIGISWTARAQESCIIQLMVAPMEQKETVSDNISNLLETKLIHAVTSHGNISVSKDYSRFFIAGRFANTRTEVIASATAPYAVRTTLMLYIGDMVQQDIFASETFNLSGLGRTEELAFQKAVDGLKESNKSFQNLIERGREMVVEYFNRNYRLYLDSARQADASGNREKALYYSTMIPPCCTGYPEAQKTTENILKKCNTNQTAAAIARSWNKQQQRPKTTISFVKYK